MAILLGCIAEIAGGMLRDILCGLHRGRGGAVPPTVIPG